MVNRKKSEIFSIVNGNNTLSILRKDNDIFTLKINNDRIDLTSGDILKLVSNINNVTSLRNGRYNVTLSDTSKIESGFIKTEPKRYISIVDNISEKKLKFDMTQTQFDNFIFALHDLKLQGNSLPFKPGEKVWVGDIGFSTENDDWSYFKEPFQAEVESVDSIGDDMYYVKIIDPRSHIGGNYHKELSIVYHNNEQIYRSFYVCGRTKDEVIDTMLQRLSDSGRIDTKIDNLPSIFEPFEDTMKNSEQNVDEFNTIG